MNEHMTESLFDKLSNKSSLTTRSIRKALKSLWYSIVVYVGAKIGLSHQQSRWLSEGVQKSKF